MDGLWELALIGRDLINAYIKTGGSDNRATTPDVTSDAKIFVVRPRQVMLQLTVRPNLFW
jgi:hypothetical protein